MTFNRFGWHTISIPHSHQILKRFRDMAPRKFRKAIGAVKDQTSIGLAKFGGGNNSSDLEIAIIKATCHDENPPQERHVRKILSLTTHSRSMVSACVSTMAKRLNKTKNWAVALKTLMLSHRLLNDGDHTCVQDIFFSARRGTRFLNMSDFRDTSDMSNSWDYSAFIRTYALYLNGLLEFRIQGCSRKHGGYAYHGEEEEEGVHGGINFKEVAMNATPVYERNNESVFSRVDHLKQLLERFLACRPTGAAKYNRVVDVALHLIVKESFELFYDMTEVIAALIDRFMRLEVPDMVRVHEIFCQNSRLYDELDAFYHWCKNVGIMRPFKFPNVERIPQSKLDTMDDFIRQKSEMLKSRKARTNEPKPKPVEAAKEAEPQKDENAVKEELPPAEGFIEATESKEEKADELKEPEEEKKKAQEVGDLLNLSVETPYTEEQGHTLALALFDGGLATAAPASTTTPWEAFQNSSEDWEMKLVQSTSKLSNQGASVPGGFDTLMLDSLYQHGAMAQAVASSGSVTNGSASSIALGTAGTAATLALPAPPVFNGGANTTSPNIDPFAASLAIAPPAYVQMSEMEKNQRLLVEEQLLWQQYARNGMQGQVGLGNVHQQIPYQYITGGYTPRW